MVEDIKVAHTQGTYEIRKGKDDRPVARGPRAKVSRLKVVASENIANT